MRRRRDCAGGRLVGMIMMRSNSAAPWPATPGAARRCSRSPNAAGCRAPPAPACRRAASVTTRRQLLAVDDLRLTDARPLRQNCATAARCPRSSVTRPSCIVSFNSPAAAGERTGRRPGPPGERAAQDLLHHGFAPRPDSIRLVRTDELRGSGGLGKGLAAQVSLVIQSGESLRGRSQARQTSGPPLSRCSRRTCR